MKKLILLLFIPLLLLVTSCELLWDEPLQGDFYYVVLGLDYTNDASTGDNGNDLEGTIHDAKELFQTFTLLSEATERNSYGYLMMQEGNSLLGTSTFTINGETISNYPSVANVTAVLKNLAEVTKQEDLIIFTYSGHGYEDTGDLALAITTYGNPTTSDALPPDALLALMDAIPGKKLLLIDSCYSGNFVKESTSSTSTVYDSTISDYFGKYFAEAIYEPPNLFAMSASANTDSYEGIFNTIDHNHGIFTYALLEALGWNHLHGTDLSTETLSTPPAGKNGRISVDGLYRYIKENQGLPYKLSLSTFPSNIQHPMTNGGALDMILFTY
ncbi:MAG: caspase family protein [Sphaerochaeta sp.]|nr:caspase family protein [Sphaerochaeta sp.]